MTPTDSSYCEIPLTQGQVALVSAHRFEEMSLFKWHALWCPHVRNYYAVRDELLPIGKTIHHRMHRLILGLDHGDKRKGDHRNHVTLDNRDANLRIATTSQNNCNRSHQTNSASGIKGVWWSKRDEVWYSQITINRKRVHLGSFSTPEEAHAAYCSAAKEMHGEFALFD